MTASARAWALRHAPDRTVTAGRLAVRCLPYLVRSRLDAQPIAGLQVRCLGWREAPVYHAQTGVYGFLDLPPGNQVLEIRDPAGFRLARRVDVTVGDRSTYLALLQAGITNPPAGAVTPPTLVDVPIRPAFAHPTSSGRTVVRGVVRDSAGAPQPFARIEIDTRYNNAEAVLVTHADARGEYAAHLAGEAVQYSMPAPESEDAPELVSAFSRAARLFRLTPGRATLAASPDPLAALPLHFDTLDPNASDSPYERPGSVIASTPAGDVSGVGHLVAVPFTAGQAQRIDFILT